MTELQVLEKIFDINTVALCIQISFFAYFIFMKWSKK